MEKKRNTIENIIAIYTIVTYIFSIITFEIGYCNTVWLKKIIAGDMVDLKYNFSLCRIVMYIIFLGVYLYFRKVFIKPAVEVMKNNYKKIFICLTIAMVAFCMGFAVVAVLKMNKVLVRAISIGLITAFLGSLLVIYISNDIIKNIIIVACTFGIVFTFTTSYNHAIDEKKHFMSALNVSFLNFDYVNNPITDKKIEELPQLSKFTIIDEFLKNDYKADVTEDVNMEDIPSTPANYNVITYIFPGLGIAIARILNGSIIDMYILGRIMNLILYTILVCIAMKILPYKKNIFFIIAFMPYMLLLATSYSVDGICLGTTYIFIAYCLKIYKECETISLKQFLILGVLFGIMLIGKGIGYMLIGSLIFILPLHKTIKKNKKYLPQIIITILVFILIATFFVIYLKNTKITSEGDSRGGNNINGVEQLNMVLNHPIYDVKIALEHIRVTLLNFDWISNLQPEAFFTSKTASATFFIMMLFILYVAITEDDYNFKIKDKIILVLTFLLVYGMTSMILYLSFTPVGALHIAGYQTRYIFPVLSLLLCCISNDKIKCDKSPNRNMNIAIGTAIFLVIGISQLIINSIR